MNQYQRPLVYYWKAHYNDGTYLSQFHPPDYQGEKFDNIDYDRLVKFGLYPFDKELAENVTKHGSEARSISILPNYEVNLTGNRRPIYYRDCFIQTEEYRICEKCGAEFRATSDMYTNSKYPSPICPKCGAHDYFYCPNCKLEMSFEESFHGMCPKCHKVLERKIVTSKQYVREKRWNIYNLGYQQIGDNKNITFIMKIDEYGNCTIV